MKKISPVLFISGIILLLINFYAIYNFGLDGSRWAKLASTLLFFLIYLVAIPKKDFYLITAFLLFIASNILYFSYEMPWVKKLTFLMVILAYSSLMLHIGPYVKNLKANLYQKLIFVGVLAINVVMLYFLIDMVEDKLDDKWHSLLFYLYGICMIALVILAFSFSNRYSNQASFYFILSILGFVFADITSFIAYYLEVEEFYYPDRFFYIIGLIALVKFAGLDKKEGMLQSGEFL